MATNPPHSHISFEFFTGGPVALGSTRGAAALTIVDHRSTIDPPPVVFPCPRNYSAPRHYRAALGEVATDLCDRCLRLPPCCVFELVPEIVARIAAVAADHCCCEVQSVELHVFPELPPTADENLRELLEEDEDEIGLMESFEAAQPRPAPASRASIEKLVAEKEGDDESSSSSRSSSDDRSCMICLDDEIIPRRSCLKMPCSHVFHQSCIVEWLKVSHVCPLCRYQMPVDDDADNSDQLN